MLIPVDCDKSHTYIITFKATTRKTIQSNIFKNTNKDGTQENVQITHRKAKKDKQ